MLDLPTPEKILFILVIVLYLAAAVLGIFLVRRGGQRYKPLQTNLFAIAVVLEALILVFRAAAIKAVPLTGSFESMIVLTLTFGLTYLFLGMFIKQVWFGLVMSWVILVMILLTAVVAMPASEPHKLAATPWAIAHGLAMTLGEMMILLSAVSAFIYLLANKRLKEKKILKVIGMIPNIEKLQIMNRFGLVAAFVLVALGLVTGFGMAYISSGHLGIHFTQWLGDPKIICIVVAWLLMGGILLSRKLLLLKNKMTAYLTLVSFLLILFALVAEKPFFQTKHDFSQQANSAAPVIPGGQE